MVLRKRERRHDSQDPNSRTERRACSWCNVVLARPAAAPINHEENALPQNRKSSDAAPLLGMVAIKLAPRLPRKRINATNPHAPLSASVLTNKL